MATMLSRRVSIHHFRSGALGVKDLQQIRKHDTILERLRHPYQIQGILIDADLLGEECSIVGAEKATSVRIDADAEVSHSYFQLGVTDDIGYGGSDARIDLRGIVDGRVHFVVEGYDEDAWYERRAGRTSCEQ